MRILLLAMLLASCSKENFTPTPKWNVALCVKNGQNCTVGTIDFTSKEACESFVKQANQAQPEVARFCFDALQTRDRYSIH